MSSDGPRCCTIRSYGRAAQPTEAEAGRVEQGAFADSAISRAVIDRFPTLGDQKRSKGSVGMRSSLSDCGDYDLLLQATLPWSWS